MRNYILLAIILAFTSCQQNKKEDKTTRFKNYIGAENYAATDAFLKSMENKLETKFGTGSAEKNIHQYMVNIANGFSELSFSIKDCEILKQYEAHGMENEYSHEKYDTVYFDGAKGIAKVHGQDTTWEISSRGMENIIAEGHRKISRPGKLTDALKKVAGQDPVLVDYIEKRKEAVYISPETISIGLLKKNLDLKNNYFHRLIVLTELYYKELKSHGC